MACGSCGTDHSRSLPTTSPVGRKKSLFHASHATQAPGERQGADCSLTSIRNTEQRIHISRRCSQFEEVPWGFLIRYAGAGTVAGRCWKPLRRVRCRKGGGRPGRVGRQLSKRVSPGSTTEIAECYDAARNGRAAGLRVVRSASSRFQLWGEPGVSRPKTRGTSVPVTAERLAGTSSR